MMDSDLVLDALSAICNAKVTSVQQQERSRAGLCAAAGDQQAGSVELTRISIPHLVPLFLGNILDLWNPPAGGQGVSPFSIITPTIFLNVPSDSSKGDQGDQGEKAYIIDEKEFLDPGYDFDFTNLKDTKTYYRGGEPYERPCGCRRFALKVLDKFEDNIWLGNSCRSTESVAGEWPVSYHGTTEGGSESIIKGHYKPGHRERYGRGIYSTPKISVALSYATKFTSNNREYKAILQNRINPKYRTKHRKDEDYWLVSVPEGTSDEDEEKIVHRAIRPYGLVVKPM